MIAKTSARGGDRPLARIARQLAKRVSGSTAVRRSSTTVRGVWFRTRRSATTRSSATRVRGHLLSGLLARRNGVTSTEKVLKAGQGREGWLGGLGIRFMISGEQSRGGFALVEHRLKPRALAAPMHRHAHEDEYSFILHGRVGAQLGEEIVYGDAGDLIAKPRGQWHTFWNTGDEEARLLETSRRRASSATSTRWSRSPGVAGPTPDWPRRSASATALRSTRRASPNWSLSTRSVSASAERLISSAPAAQWFVRTRACLPPRPCARSPAILRGVSDRGWRVTRPLLCRLS